MVDASTRSQDFYGDQITPSRDGASVAFSPSDPSSACAICGQEMVASFWMCMASVIIECSSVIRTG